MYQIINYLDHTIVTILSYPFVIQVAIFFILTNFILGLIFYIGMLVTRQLKKEKEKNFSKNAEEIKEFIMQVIYDESSMNSDLIREDFEDRFGNLDKKNFELFVQVLESKVDDNNKFKNELSYLN